MQSWLLWTLSGTINMKLLLAVLWASCNDTVFLQACEEKALDNGLTCVTDYWLRISCVLNTAVQPLNRALSHWLVFHDCIEGESKFECQLVNVGDYFRCTTKAEIGVDTFMSSDHFKVTLHSKMSGHETCMSINSTFWPACNIKPNTPSNLTVIRNSRTYLFTWISNYERHPYIREEFDYKLLYYRTGFPDQVNIVHTKVKTLNMSDTILETDTEYTAVVCSLLNRPYQGQWSEWSPLVHWRTNAKPVRGWDAFRFVWNVALPMCVVAGILLFFFFSHTDRLKVKVWSIVPTPAPYFQPLYNSYKGNFRSWLLSQGGPGEPLRLEEVVKIDTLMEVQPLKEEEENCPPTPTSHPYPTSLTHVPYPTPYVAPGNEGWCTGSHAPSPAPDTPPSLSLLKVSLAEIFGSQSLDLVLAGADEWECENHMHSLDSCWAGDRLTSKPEDLCVRKDYCTLSGPHNELVPAAALTPASAKVDPCSGYSHNALGPQADIDGV